MIHQLFLRNIAARAQDDDCMRSILRIPTAVLFFNFHLADATDSIELTLLDADLFTSGKKNAKGGAKDKEKVKCSSFVARRHLGSSCSCLGHCGY